MVTQSTRVSSHSTQYGSSSLLDRQGDRRTRTRWPYEWFGCEYGYLGQISEYQSSSSHFILDKTMTRIYIMWRIIFGTVWDLFHETEKLISEHEEITGVSTKDFHDATWMSTSLLCEKASRITNATTYVFSDSVHCVGKVGDDPIVTWKRKINWYSENNHFKDKNRIDGMPTVLFGPRIRRVYRCRFRTIFSDPGTKKRPMIAREFTSIIRNCLWIIFTPFCISFSPIQVVVHWHDDDPAYEVLRFTLEARGKMKFSESGHPMFRASSAFERGDLRSKGGC